MALPADHGFVQWCRPLGMKELRHFLRDGEAMVRLISVAGALRAAGPEMAVRDGGSGRLSILTNLDDVGLEWRDGEMHVGSPARGAARVSLPQWALAQMLYGYRGARALADRGERRASARTVARLQAMLPEREHFHYAADMF